MNALHRRDKDTRREGILTNISNCTKFVTPRRPATPSTACNPPRHIFLLHSLASVSVAFFLPCLSYTRRLSVPFSPVNVFLETPGTNSIRQSDGPQSVTQVVWSRPFFLPFLSLSLCGSIEIYISKIQHRNLSINFNKPRLFPYLHLQSVRRRAKETMNNQKKKRKNEIDR